MLTGTRWTKIRRDLLDRRGRSMLVVLALAAGVFEVTAMLYKYALLEPSLHAMYGLTHPASATLITDAADDEVVAAVRAVPGVADAEARPVILTRIRVAGEWVPAVLYVMRDFTMQRMDLVLPNDGTWPPGPGDLLIERTALQVAKAARGDTVTLRTENGEDHPLRLAGTVYAAGLPPAWMEHFVPGFIAWNSPLRGSERGESSQIRILVADHPLDEGHIREVADSVKAMLEHRGHTVTRITVPTPGRHPHADQMEAFLFLILAFGIVSFVLSVALVASTIQARMAEEVRQIGMMKAIGATRAQVAGIYLAEVAVLATLALAIGIPAGVLLGNAYARFAAGILNADITNRPFPFLLIVLEIVAGLLIPLLVALVPVLRASGITVREALADDPPLEYGARRFDRWMASRSWLPRPLALSLRSTLERRGRLAITVLTLALGGAAFVSALNVSEDWVRTVKADFAARRYDVAVQFAKPTSLAAIERVLEGVSEVSRSEAWPSGSPYLLDRGGVPGGTVVLLGVPEGSRLLELKLTAGRWLVSGDSLGVVVNRVAITRQRRVEVGDTLRVRLAGRDVALHVVGITREIAPVTILYAPASTVAAATGLPAGTTRSLRVVARTSGEGAQRLLAAALERAFSAGGIEVSGMQRLLDSRQAILDHLVIILSVLTMASVIVVFVGALALVSTLVLAVVRRTREIGILGALGATPSVIARQIWIEGLFIGLLSWGVANVLAAPISGGLEAACGRIFLQTPLPFFMSARASGAWLLLVLVLASVCSFYPARRAARLNVRQALNRE